MLDGPPFSPPPAGPHGQRDTRDWSAQLREVEAASGLVGRDVAGDGESSLLRALSHQARFQLAVSSAAQSS